MAPIIQGKFREVQNRYRFIIGAIKIVRNLFAVISFTGNQEIA